MLSVESLQVAEEEVVESSSNKLGDIYTFVAKGCFPQTVHPLRKKNLRRYAQKFIFDGEDSWKTLWECIACLWLASRNPFKKHLNNWICKEVYILWDVLLYILWICRSM